MNPRPVVLLTGAAGGIGQAAAVEFARRGYDLALVDRPESALSAVAQAVRDAGGQALVHAGDLADLGFAESVVRQTVEQFGRLDVLVNNAAWRELVTMRQISLESWERTLRVCLTTPAFLARWAAAAMTARGRGVILNVSSIQSVQPDGLSPAYVAAKGGLDALTYELAVLYGRAGIRVLSVSPGAVDTALSQDLADAEGRSLTAELRRANEDAIPLGRWARPEEIARLLVLLAGDDASYLTGVTVVADGGWTHNANPYRIKRLFAPEQFP
jgi:3-oxoacyl-[acyl-carrier protein] reductase